MKKTLIIIFSIIMSMLFIGCEAKDLPDEKYDKVAKLYVEVLWRDINDEDLTILELCSSDMQTKIYELRADAKLLLDRNKFLSKNEAIELVGDLTEYYETQKKIRTEDMRIMAEALGDINYEPQYTPTKVCTKDQYEVKRVSKNTGEISLEDGNRFTFRLTKEYNGEYEIILSNYEDNIYRYKVTLEEKTFFIYLDVEDGIVKNIKEDLN